MDYRIVKDPTDGLILETDKPNDLLAVFFAADIQQDPELCHYYLKRITKVLNGESFHTDLTGNAHTVVATPVNVTITSLFDETAKPLELKTVIFKQLLEEWYQKLLNIVNNDT